METNVTLSFSDLENLLGAPRNFRIMRVEACERTVTIAFEVLDVAPGTAIGVQCENDSVQNVLCGGVRFWAKQT